MENQMPSGRTLDTDFAFTKLWVNDLNLAAAFYSSVFGLCELHRLDAEIVGQAVSEVVYMSTSAGGPLFVLVKNHSTSGSSSGELTLGFSTQDLDALLVRLQKADGQILDVTEDAMFKTAFAKDPEGHNLQITQAVA